MHIFLREEKIMIVKHKYIEHTLVHVSQLKQCIFADTK